jgi:nucleoside-diphosphate-sugar epimerase
MRVKDARQTFLGWWIRQVIEGQEVQVFGDGTQLRDFNDVDDAADAFLRAAVQDTANGKVFNLGSAEVIGLKDLAALLVEVYGRGTFRIVPFPEDRKRIDIGHYYGDYTSIRRALGWAPGTPLRETLARTLAYYTGHAVHYWEPST